MTDFSQHAPLAMALGFAACLVASMTLKFWLAARQVRYVAQHRGTVPAAFASRISLADHQKAADYTIAQVRLGMLEAAWSCALTLCWTLLGALSLLNQTLAHWVTTPVIQQVALLMAFLAISAVLDLPLGLYRTFVLEQRFGFNKTSLSLWLQDLGKSAILALLVGTPIAALIVWMMGATGAWWWLWTWGAWMAINLLLMLVYPTWIAPWFNQFKPLDDEQLRLRVAQLMEKSGFRSSGIYVMDGSRRSAHANAYFTGLGRSKRVVFYDTLLKQLTAPETDAVLAHELGHFVRKHIIKRLLSLFAFSLAGFALLGWLGQQAWFYVGMGVWPNAFIANDALALLLFMMLLPTVTVFFSPLLAGISRKHEFEADAHAKTLTSGSALAAALLKLHVDNASTLTPDPVYARFYYSHPPASERMGRLIDELVPA
jgi:STE24 endopeptidase